MLALNISTLSRNDNGVVPLQRAGSASPVRMLSTKPCSKRIWSSLIWYLILNFVNADQHHSSYQRPVTDDELTSPITRTIDKSFSRFAEEVQSDKSNRGSSYHYIYSKLPTSLHYVKNEPQD